MDDKVSFAEKSLDALLDQFHISKDIYKFLEYCLRAIMSSKSLSNYQLPFSDYSLPPEDLSNDRLLEWVFREIKKIEDKNRIEFGYEPFVIMNLIEDEIKVSEIALKNLKISYPFKPIIRTMISEISNAISMNPFGLMNYLKKDKNQLPIETDQKYYEFFKYYLAASFFTFRRFIREKNRSEDQENVSDWFCKFLSRKIEINFGLSWSVQIKDSNNGDDRHFNKVYSRLMANQYQTIDFASDFSAQKIKNRISDLKSAKIWTAAKSLAELNFRLLDEANFADGILEDLAIKNIEDLEDLKIK